jgi:hypothetical protein
MPRVLHKERPCSELFFPGDSYILNHDIVRRLTNQAKAERMGDTLLGLWYVQALPPDPISNAGSVPKNRWFRRGRPLQFMSSFTTFEQLSRKFGSWYLV